MRGAPENETTWRIFILVTINPLGVSTDRPIFNRIPLSSQKNFSEIPGYSETGHLYSVASLTYSNEKVLSARVKYIKPYLSI